MRRVESIWSVNNQREDGIPPIPIGSVAKYLKQKAALNPDITAIEFENKKTTFSKLINQIDEAAKSLCAMGIKKGDFVSIVTPNIPQAIIMFYAVNEIGAVANMLHPLLSISELKNYIENTDSRLILTLDILYPKFKNVVWKDGYKPNIVLAKIPDALPRFLSVLYKLKNKLPAVKEAEPYLLSWKSFLKLGKTTALPKDSGDSNDLAALMYSGGTTGSQKAVKLSNENINAYAIQIVEVSFRGSPVGKRSLALMPIFHGFGLAGCVHATLCAGLNIFLIPKYDFKACSNLIVRKKINMIFGVPAFFEAFSRSEKLVNRDLSFIILLISGGDVVPHRLSKRLSNYLQQGGSSAKLVDAYGQTECVAGCCINPFFAMKEGSVGVPFPYVEMKLVTPGTTQEAAPGCEGEICVSGATVALGYFNNEQETSNTFRLHPDGKRWLHTGDLAYRDEDGYYFFRQRLSRLIITSGYNVYPTVVESAIRSCSIVKDVCVVGIPEPSIGERVRAYVILKSDDNDLTHARNLILSACKNNVAEYSVPKDVIFVKEFPFTSLGKIDFSAIKKMQNEKAGRINA